MLSLPYLSVLLICRYLTHCIVHSSMIEFSRWKKCALYGMTFKSNKYQLKSQLKNTSPVAFISLIFFALSIIGGITMTSYRLIIDGIMSGSRGFRARLSSCWFFSWYTANWIVRNEMMNLFPKLRMMRNVPSQHMSN